MGGRHLPSPCNIPQLKCATSFFVPEWRGARAKLTIVLPSTSRPCCRAQHKTMEAEERGASFVIPRSAVFARREIPTSTEESKVGAAIPRGQEQPLGMTNQERE